MGDGGKGGSQEATKNFELTETGVVLRQAEGKTKVCVGHLLLRPKRGKDGKFVFSLLQPMSIILHTTNGGKDWELQHSPTNFYLTGIEMVDLQTGFITTSGETDLCKGTHLDGDILNNKGWWSQLGYF